MFNSSVLKEKSSIDVADEILDYIGKHCALYVNGFGVQNEHVEKCYGPHVSRVANYIDKGTPILFVLPAFPGKSPNLAKVIGTWPDLAERTSLIFLNDLCNTIQEMYAPGARIIICSDGRVFSDVIGMADSNITKYQEEIRGIIDQLQLTNLSTFNLDELYEGKKFDLMREKLLEEFGNSIDVLREKVRKGAKDTATREDREANRMYRGITKFLFEDSLYPGQTKSRTEIQKDAKKRAYHVIQRSNAWSQLIGMEFSDHVRLSIHPQTCGDVKLGVKLLAGKNYITPWHGVALDRAGEITFVKRFEAEKLGATLVYDSNGRADHYRL